MVMRKREKRTGTWRGLGNLLCLEIDVRAHDVRISGNRQKYEGARFGVLRLVTVQLREGEWEWGVGVSEMVDTR